MSASYNALRYKSWLSVSGGEPNGPDGPWYVRKVPAWEPTDETVTAEMGCTWRSRRLKVTRVEPPLDVDGAIPSPVEPNDPNEGKWYFAGWREDPEQYVTLTATLNVDCEPNEAKVVLGWSGAMADPNDGRRSFVSKNTPQLTTVTASCATQARAKVGIIKLTGLGVSGAAQCAGKYLMGVREEGEYVTFTAGIDPYVDPNLLPAGLVQWSGGEFYQDYLHRRLPAWEPGETEVRCTIGDSNEAETIKIVDLERLNVTGATEMPDPNDPGGTVYVACYSEEGGVRIRAVLNPTCTDTEARCVLQWSGGAPDPNDPNNWTKRYVPLNSPGWHTVTATVGATTNTVTICVIKINWIELASAEHPELSRRNPPDANDLYIPDSGESTTSVLVNMSYAPPDAGPFIAVYLDVGFGALEGTLDDLLGEGSLPVEVRLITAFGLREFDLSVSVDLDGSGTVSGGDCGELGLTVHVVEVDIDVDSNNDGTIDESDDSIEDIAGDYTKPGKVIAWNNDDDNENGVVDYDAGETPVAGENDLVPVQLGIVGAPSDMGSWRVAASDGSVRVWREANKTTEVSTTERYICAEDPLPSTLYVEGVSVSSVAAQVELKLYWDPAGGSGTSFDDSARVTVATVELADIWLPCGFLGTFDEDPHRLAWYQGISEAVENRFAVAYRVTPPMDFACDASRLTFALRGDPMGGHAARSDRG